MVGLSVAMSTSTTVPLTGVIPKIMSPTKKRPADEPLLDPDRSLDHKRSRKSLRSGSPSLVTKNVQPHAVESLRGLQDEQAFQKQLERSLSLILAAEGFDGATPAAMESLRAMTEQFSLHFLGLVHSSMNISGRTSPTPQDFIVALNHLNLTPSKLEAYTEIPTVPLITQPSIPVDMSADTLPAKLDKVLGPDLIISSSSDELRTVQTEQMSRRFKNFVPNHLPELPSLHTWRSTAVWATDRGEKAEERQADARNVRERATKEGVMAEQALRRLLTASKKGKKGDEEDHGDGNISNKKKSKVQIAWERARDTILVMDKDAREQEEAEEAAVAAEFDEPDPVLDVLSDVLEPKAPTSWRKARRMLEEEQRMEDEDEELTMSVNCERKFWREGARGRH